MFGRILVRFPWAMSVVLKTDLKPRVKKYQLRAMMFRFFNEFAVAALNNPSFMSGKKYLK